MKIKMIVTDLDGTLLRTDKTISEESKYVLCRCKEAGIKTVYATGRGGSAERVAPDEFFDGKISMNGATAKIGDKIVYSRLIPYSVATADRTGTLLQIMSREATKAKAVAELARLWGIMPDEIAAFGDDLNDIDMLTYAGFGVAMDNAPDEIKAAAKYICKSNDENGVADWITKNQVFMSKIT